MAVSPGKLTVLRRVGGEARDTARLVVVLDVRQAVRLVLRVRELLREFGEALELGELPLLLHERVLAARVVEVHLVELNDAVERLRLGADVRENLFKLGRVRELSHGQAAATFGVSEGS